VTWCLGDAVTLKDFMKIIGVIPARWASTRFPGKVLADLNGKPLIQHVWQQAKKAALLNDVIIACDDCRVKEASAAFGARVVMTSPDHASGTDRIAEAVKNIDADIVVNIQGDEPLIDPKVIDELAAALKDDEHCSMATVIKGITDSTQISNPNVVKVVVDRQGVALYFSRHAIPFNRDGKPLEANTYFKHLGLYAYRKEFLLGFHALPYSRLEHIEKLEQLRVLEAGYRIKTIQTDFETIGVDTPEDLRHVAQLLSEAQHG
jgi:3-deoxy-manno-octulosonate cytidylyltransferase (CMP-KDO synthetase)